MKITAALRQYLVAKSWIAADATDDVVKAAVTQRLMSGELDAAKIAELNAEPGTGAKTAIATAVSEAMAPILAQFESFKSALKPAEKPPEQKPPEAKPPENAVTSQSDIDAAVSKAVADVLQRVGLGTTEDSITPTKLFSRAAQSNWLSGKPAVKGAIERFSSAKSAAHWGSDCKHHDLRGRRLTAPSEKGPGLGRPLDTPSTADEAVIGAFWKWSLACNSPGEYPAQLKMTDEDFDLVRHAQHEMAWVGNLGGDNGEGVDNVKLTDAHRKALLDDSVSGGITLVPQVLDDALIMTPLLYGELFPLVTVTNLTRGRRIEAATMGRTTFTSGIAEGTAIPLFDTTGFIGALDTVIQNAVGAIEIGNDFQEDSSIANLGGRIIATYGEAALAWLDMVVAVGDGTTQPQGIFTASGTTAVSSTNGVGGPAAIGDLEGLMFGVNKAFRTSKGGGRNVFIGNETTYARMRGIPEATGSNMRAFGMDYGDYTALGFPFKISTDVPNSKLAFVNMAYYQMYRRLGTQVKVERGGKELTLRNVTLITVRMRYGGKLTLGGSAAVVSDLES